jgi:hypothetical protein
MADLLYVFISMLSFEKLWLCFVLKYIYFWICIAARKACGCNIVHLFIHSDNSALGLLSSQNLSLQAN